MALAATPKEKHQYIKVVTHHPANENAGDLYTWQQILDFGIEEVRIPDQNTHLKVDIERMKSTKRKLCFHFSWISYTKVKKCTT